MYKNAKKNCLCNSEHICKRTIVHQVKVREVKKLRLN